MPQHPCLQRAPREEWLSCQAFPVFRASETWRGVPDPDRPKGVELSSPPGRVERNNRPRGERVSTGSRPRFPVTG